MENNENKSFETEEELQNDAAVETVEETAEIAEEAAESAENAVESFVEKAEDAVENAVENAGEFIEEVKENVTEAFENIPEMSSEVVSKAKNNKGIVAVISIVGVLLIAAIVTLCYNFFVKVPTDGSAVVLTMGDKKMTEADFRYFMVGEAYKIQYSKLLEKVNALDTNAGEDAVNNIIKEFSWETVDEETGKTYGEMAKENALNAAMRQFVSMNKAAELGIVLTEEEKSNIASYSENLKTQYGENYEEVLIANGLQSHEHSQKMFESSQLVTNLSNKFAEDPAAVGLTDLTALADYAETDSASVKHILLVTTDEETGEAVSEEKKAEIRAKAEEILARAKNGEDFDALVAEFNQDPGATEAGYTFGPGEMVPEFESASFALKIGEISDIVETSYGFHIIKRIAGFNELQNMWIKESGVKVNERVLSKIPVQKDEENAFKPSDETEESNDTASAESAENAEPASAEAAATAAAE